MKTNLMCLFFIVFCSCNSSVSEKEQKSSDVFRVEFQLTGTELTNDMTISIRTSKDCHFTDNITKTSTKMLEEPEKLKINKKDTASFSTNGKYILLTVNCGSSTFDGAMMKVYLYKNNKLIRQLGTKRLRPNNTLEYNTREDRL